MTEVTTVDNMRKSDAFTIERGTPAAELMARAAKAIFVSAKWREPVGIVCGTGNNAGDGFAVAVLMAEAGIQCTLFLLSDKMSETGAYFYKKAVQLGVESVHGIDGLCLDGYNSVLDCIFGTGFHGEVGEPYRTAIQRINESGLYTVSADINSGLGGDSGLCDICVRSDLTVSIGTYKSGLFLNSAMDVIKEKINCDIGIELAEKPAYLIGGEDIAHLFEGRLHNSNKGDYGYVNLIGGSVEYSGAAKLANLSLSALRAGAGVAKLAVPGCLSDAVLPYLLESTFFPLDDADGRFLFSRDTAERLTAHTAATAVGMGMGRSKELEKLLEYLLTEYRGRLIIDADGLNVLSQMDRKLLKNASCRVILTPHPKEFERLSGVPIADFRDDLIAAAKEYAADTGVILLLKGAATVITDGETVYLTDRGCAGMATAGSGDVLSGVLAGICGYVSDSELALGIAAGAYITGLAGELACRDIPEASMLSGDTVRYLPAAIKEILS